MSSEEVSEGNQPGNEGKNESDSNKSKDKKYRNTPLTKVVIRRLPPSMTLEKFIDQVSPIPENDYLHFAKADITLGQYAFCTAYVNFVNPRDVYLFTEKFDDYCFIDSKGNEYRAVVEFAPFQKIPRKKSRQRDPKCGTIYNDSDYLTFLSKIKQTQDDPNENVIKSTGGKSSPLLSVQDVLEEIEAKAQERKNRRITTPLIEHIKQQKIEKQRMKDEKKEERKRREVERKRAKEEERKHRREANREAIQNKRERKEQRKDGGSRHEDRFKMDTEGNRSRSDGHGGGSDGTKHRKDDNKFEDAEEDEDEEANDDEEEEEELYDQEQTQKLKEILRIGVASKGTEKTSQGETTSETSEGAIPKKSGAEKSGRGGNYWERGNRTQRGSGSYNEDYQGARPKTNRSEMGGQERRGGKEKKQGDSRQYVERHNQKSGKVWLNKGEPRNQKHSEERIKIQKSDTERIPNESEKKGEEPMVGEGRLSSSTSEDLIHNSSQVTTPSSEVEEPGSERISNEGKVRKEPVHKDKTDSETKQGNQDKNSSKSSQDSGGGSSNNPNANGEVRRMRNKVGTSRDSGSQKMIKNKDRPSIEIYRPGMRRLNQQKKDPDGGGNNKGQSNSSSANNDAASDSSTGTASGHSNTHPNAGNVKGKDRDDKRRVAGGRGGGNKRREGYWKQNEDGGNVRHEGRNKGREDRGRGGWVGQGEGVRPSNEGNGRDRYEEKLIKEDQVEVRSMTFKRSVSRD